MLNKKLFNEKKYLIVVADYYKDITKGLLDSALKLIPKSNLIKIVRVPGVFEIPVTIIWLGDIEIVETNQHR